MSVESAVLHWRSSVAEVDSLALVVEGFKGSDFLFQLFNGHPGRVDANGFCSVHQHLIGRPSTGFKVGDGSSGIADGCGLGKALLEYPLKVDAYQAEIPCNSWRC